MEQKNRQPIFKFLYKYRKGGLVAVAWVVLSGILLVTLQLSHLLLVVLWPGYLAVLLMLVAACFLQNFVWRTFGINIAGAGEACVDNWVAFMLLFIFLAITFFIGSLVELFLRRFINTIQIRRPR